MANVSSRTRALGAVLVGLWVSACGGREPVEAPTPPPPAEVVVEDTAAADTAAVVAEPMPDPDPEPAPEPPPEPEPADPSGDRVPEAGPAAIPVLPGAVLPTRRIVAFYGNPASKRMGILGELPPEQMLARLDREVESWRAADPGTPVKPALHMIAVMATGDPGRDSVYRLRMPDWRIEKVVEWADRRDALVFLDIQPGQSSVQQELPRLEEWLKQPDVHLALDPEWSMAPGTVPGTAIGSMSAEDVNFAVDFLAEMVEAHGLPPKVLVVHRFTQRMIRNAEHIRLDPRVQVVVNMDGWGPPSQKRYAYREIVAPEATQFTGFKLFYKNDRRNDSRLMTPEEILELSPAPVYIQYQ